MSETHLLLQPSDMARSAHDQVYQDALAGPRSSRRTSIRSAPSSRGLDAHSLPYLHIQISRLARTCDVEFLESMVPSMGPKDAANKETELLRRLARHIEEHPDIGDDTKRPATRSGVQQQPSWQNGTDLDPDAASHALRLSLAASGSESSDLAVSNGLPVGIQESLNSILKELRRCESSKSLSPSFKQFFTFRRGNRIQESKEFVKCLRKNIKMVENMMPEASELGHHDLAVYINDSSNSLEREISSMLTGGTKSSSIQWDMLHLQTAQIMAEIKSKWELAAEARKSFQSFAQICVAKYIQQRKQQAQMEKISDANRDDASGQQSAWRNFQEAHRAASSIGKSPIDGSATSLRSFYCDPLGETTSFSDYSAPLSPSSSSAGRPGYSRGSRSSSRRDMEDPMSINIARWGGDRAATTDLITRIRALSPSGSNGLGYIHEED